MYEKIIVTLMTIIITMVRYIQMIPVRGHLKPGGEMFIPLWVFVLWVVGHEFLMEVRRAERGGYGINDDV